MRVLLLVLCALAPTVYVARQYARQGDLTPIIFFGEYFAPRELPEIKAMHPAIPSRLGFDGQFYAQMALDPTLRRSDLPAATDGIAYRAQRIFLPALAWLLGGGQPRAIVTAYALLNLAFWYALLAAVARRLPATNPRGFLVLYAIMLSTGALVSIQYALTDLPAATLGFIALGLAEIPGALLIACAILTKPTAALFLCGFFAQRPRGRRGWLRMLAVLLFALVPPVLWHAYVTWLFRDQGADTSQFAVPFSGWCYAAISSVADFFQPHAPGHAESGIGFAAQVCEVLGLLSGMVQVVFLAIRPRWRQPLWLAGAAFAVLFLCLSDKNYASVGAYSRTVFPMTLAFNFLLLELRSAPAFLALFVAGNIGFIGGLGEMIFVSCR